LSVAVSVPTASVGLATLTVCASELSTSVYVNEPLVVNVSVAFVVSVTCADCELIDTTGASFVPTIVTCTTSLAVPPWPSATVTVKSCVSVSPAARALAGARVSPRQHVLAGVEVGPPLALVVEELAVGEERAAHGVSGRQTVEREVVDDRRGEVLDVHRAPGEVDHLRPRDDIGNAICPGWPAVRRWQPAVECARSDRDGQERVVADLLHRGEEGLAAHQAVDPSVGQRDRPFHDRDVLARVGGDGT